MKEDILKQAKAAAKSLDYCPDFADEQQTIMELIAEAERLRSDRTEKDARIKALSDVISEAFTERVLGTGYWRHCDD